MGLFALEHSKSAYRADFIAYTAASATMAAVLLVASPRERDWQFAGIALAGMAGWTLIEYLLHRFVLHGLRPFSDWHAEHHDRPMALICSPTVFSASLIAALVFLPAWILGDVWSACAVTFGLLCGYLAYAVTHHATHHWRAESAWLLDRKRWHALHHHRSGEPAYFGVTSGFWDRVFGTGKSTK